MRIVVDTREQFPFVFSAYPGVELVAGTLNCGDCSLPGLEDRIAIERKSLADFIGSISSGRERFENELRRAANHQCFKIVVEGASYEDVCAGGYGSKMSSYAVVQTIRAWEMRYRCPIKFYRTRAGAEAEVYESLRLYLEHESRRAKSVLKLLKKEAA